MSKLVIFDLDGTLTDTEHIWDVVRRGLAEAEARRGRGQGAGGGERVQDAQLGRVDGAERIGVAETAHRNIISPPK